MIGRWHVGRQAGGRRFVARVFDERGREVAAVTGADANKNARLIAAAPRMLAFIKAGYIDADEAAAILREVRE